MTFYDPTEPMSNPASGRYWISTTSAGSVGDFVPQGDGTAINTLHGQPAIYQPLPDQTELDRLKEQVDRLAVQLQQALKENQLKQQPVEISEPKTPERKLVFD